MSLLEQILAAKRREVEHLSLLPLPDAPPRRPTRLRRPPGAPLRLIAEIKRRSPSAGPLSRVLSVGDRAAAYERAGASMVSVLSDGEFFDGSYEHLAEARASSSLPLLCKDFIIDRVQLRAARAWGADAALLIVRCLTLDQLAALVKTARELDLEPLVEVASAAELGQALQAGADWIGVNARDLDTLAMDMARAQQVLDLIPRSAVRTHLSGVASVETVTAIAASSTDAALVGEVLMRQDHPEELLTRFRSAC